jgi:hypothetical protein
MYDYEYSSAFIDKLLDNSFISTPAKVFEPMKRLDSFVLNTWNNFIAFHNSLTISPKNSALAGARKIMDGEASRPSSALQDFGMDAFTLSLRLGDRSEATFSVLSDFAKMAIYAFRLAEANERAIESTFFNYLIANRKFSVLKDVIVQIGFIVFSFAIVYV